MGLLIVPLSMEGLSIGRSDTSGVFGGWEFQRVGSSKRVGTEITRAWRREMCLVVWRGASDEKSDSAEAIGSAGTRRARIVNARTPIPVATITTFLGLG